MIKIENTETYGWEAAIRGLRNPMNSWAKSDSFECVHDCEHCSDHKACDETSPANEANAIIADFFIGFNDADLMMRMNKAGSEESKYRRMITVTMDVVAPLYWWKEFDTYKVGTVCNSCSTMHKIHSKDFEINDFSTEHLNGGSLTVFANLIQALNYNRQKFIDSKDKSWWWQLIQLLPSSYNQRRTIQLNYEVLANIYRQRKSHKLDEWHTFCDWIKNLPYSALITGEVNEQ